MGSMRMLAGIRTVLALVMLQFWCGTAAAAEGLESSEGLESGSSILVDRIVALVDEAPIFLSDLVAAEELEIVPRNPDEAGAAYRRRVLEQIIDERLRYAVVRRHGVEDIDLEAVDAQIAALRDRAGSQQQYEASLRSAGLSEARLRELIARQLAVWNFVENRLGARVFVDLDQIEAYYRDELVPEMEERGEPVPDLRQVREPLRELIYQRRLSEEVDRWTAQLRFEADISDYLDRPTENGSALTPQRSPIPSLSSKSASPEAIN